MNLLTPALLSLVLAACTSSAPLPSAASASATPAPPGAKARLTIEVHGSGSILGSVTSTPAGISACKDTCAAELPRGPVTLSFTPEGAGYVAQFYLVKAGGQPKNCGDHPAAASDHCALDLDGDLTVQVYPISVPPPAPAGASTPAPQSYKDQTGTVTKVMDGVWAIVPKGQPTQRLCFEGAKATAALQVEGKSVRFSGTVGEIKPNERRACQPFTLTAADPG
jgi:hypothetical protein